MCNRRILKTSAYLFSILLLLSLGANAQVKLASIFTDDMVLQQQAKVPVWGWSSPNKSVSVQTSWNHKSYTSKADQNGKWKVFVETPKAGGPYELKISDCKAITLKNILIGEVWILGGQSNMEMPMKGFRSQPVIGSNDAIVHSANSNLRLYIVPRSAKFEVQENKIGRASV